MSSNSGQKIALRDVERRNSGVNEFGTCMEVLAFMANSVLSACTAGTKDGIQVNA
ncbi:hypothetical protein SBDP1_370001 [Syntrophobacter sp. SbD1]|nr:hypothetical protein SBDP1_370001 [Syntrophobacter sp. SbD1]